jgi:hypothetical protein
MKQWLDYFNTLHTTGTCPGIRTGPLTVIQGTDNPRSDIEGVASMLVPLGYSAVIIAYNSAQRLNIATLLHNDSEHALYTDTVSFYMDPLNPTNTNPQPPQACVIVQRLSVLEAMRNEG